MQKKSNISGSQLIATALVCVATLASSNFVVQRKTAHTVSRRLLADAAHANSIPVMALGNSLMRSGFIPESFAPPDPKAGPVAVNLALGASTPVEQLLVFREAVRANSNPGLLFYGFYDFQLTDLVMFANADIIGNHDILYYQEPEFARRFYQMSRYDTAAFEIMRRAPMLAERGAIWGRVELLRRAMGQQGMPSEVRNQFGRAADFTLLEAKSRQEFEGHCVAAARASMNEPVAEIIREAQENGSQVVFILMPVPPRHVQTFYATAAWAEYERHLRSLVKEKNVTYIDASGWISDPGKFGDALHLTDEGAQEFSRRLGALCSDPNEALMCQAR